MIWLKSTNQLPKPALESTQIQCRTFLFSKEWPMLSQLTEVCLLMEKYDVTTAGSCPIYLLLQMKVILHGRGHGDLRQWLEAGSPHLLLKRLEGLSVDVIHGVQKVQVFHAARGCKGLKVEHNNSCTGNIQVFHQAWRCEGLKLEHNNSCTGNIQVFHQAWRCEGLKVEHNSCIGNIQVFHQAWRCEGLKLEHNNSCIGNIQVFHGAEDVKNWKWHTTAAGEKVQVFHTIWGNEGLRVEHENSYQYHGGSPGVPHNLKI